MSGKAHPPELKKFMDKRVHLKINGNRAVEGILRGFDPFMNLVLDETIEFTKVRLEMKVESQPHNLMFQSSNHTVTIFHTQK